MREHSGWWEEVDSGQLRASTKVDPLTATQEVAKNSVLTIPLSFDIWSKLERWKGLMSGCLVSWLKLKSFWSVVAYCMQQQTISWSDCDIQWKSGFDTTAGDDQLWLNGEEAPKHFPKSNLHPKKGHDHCLVVCCWPDPLQLSESQQNHYNWEVCSANQWDAPKPTKPAASIGHRMGLVLHSSTWSHVTQPTLQQLNEWATKLYFICHIRLTSHWLPLLQAFQQLCRENTTTTNRMQKMLSKSSIESWSMDFYTIGISLFLISKNMLIVMVPTLINKDVFEPSYNDLKFTVQNHNYFCTSLIIFLLTGESFF